jgi:hypothetical protein
LFKRAPDKKHEPETEDINPVCRQVARIPRFRSRFLILNIINIKQFYNGNMLNLVRRLITKNSTVTQVARRLSGERATNRSVIER